ncbi:MAG: flagellar basal-body rod protein FlgF [Bdellovibrionaceae bacterium]|nr:flagellar basal-body rod protein FlgF [Pseudobdellovibrionaceae bacterium]
MSKGIFTAVSGAMAQATKLDTIANNLANVNTPGFKRDTQVFQEYLASYEKEPNAIEVPRVPASIESFYDMQGGDKSYVDAAGTFTDFTQGGLRPTGNPLDLAIEGEGFFEVLTPSGPRLSRSGSLTIDGEGTLVTKQGYPVLRDGGLGQDPQGRVIRVGGQGQVTVSQAGEVFEGGENIGRLSVLTVGNPDALSKTGNNMFAFKENMNPELAVAQDVKVHQGFLEASNVNIIQEMTDMIAATRVFESTQKAIQAYDSMSQKVVNDVPKLG